MRIFVPVTPAALRAAVPGGSLGPVAVAFAVTAPDLTAEDEEELALEATEAAAWRSLQLLAVEAEAGPGAGSGPGPAPADLRRVVLTVDLADDAVLAVPPPDPLAAEGAVVPVGAVGLDAVVSVLADGVSLAPVLAAALSAVIAKRTAEDLDDPELVAADPALAALDEVLATPLLWFDAVELAHLFAVVPPADRAPDLPRS